MTHVWREASIRLATAAFVAVVVAATAQAGAPTIPAPATRPAATQPVAAVKQGDTYSLQGRKATVTAADVVPYVENQYSQVFVWEKYDRPELKELREKYKLADVIAPGKTEYEKQVLLMDWVYKQWKFGHAQKLYDLRDPMKILEEAQKGHKFQCMHSEVVLRAVTASLGWEARPMGKPKHTYNEVWSNQFRKWMHFDATSNTHAEANGIPLSTYELRMGLLTGDANAITVISNGTRKPGSTKWGQTWRKISYYMTNTYATRGGKVFTIKDDLSDGVYHNWPYPENPQDLYFPIHQAAVSLTPDGPKLKVAIKTLTPNFKESQVRLDGGEWKASGESFTWTLRKGTNRLESRSLNLFDVVGPVSTVVLEVAE